MSKFPNKQHILNFNQVCYNTAVEFIDGFNQDDVLESKYGKYCKQRINDLAHQIGEKNFIKKVSVPVITLRSKFFSEGLKKFGNPEEAKNYCLQQSREHDTNSSYCESSYIMYQNFKSNPKSERENYETRKKEPTKNNSDNTEDKPNCTIVSIVSVLLALLFIISMVLTINMLTTGVIQKK